MSRKNREVTVFISEFMVIFVKRMIPKLCSMLYLQRSPESRFTAKLNQVV